MTKQFWLGLSAGAMMAVLAAASFFANSETVLRSSFATALTRTATAPQAKEVASVVPPVSGSEDFWLTAMRRDGSSPVTKAVTVGDQISMTLSGQHRTFQVATVADFAPQITEIDTSASPSHLVLVTARDVHNSSAPPVRFVMEIDGGNAPIVAGRAGRTL
jgi:hypothetical protein